MIQMVGYYTVAGLWTAAAAALREAGTRTQVRSLPHFDSVERQFSSVVMEREDLRIRSAYEAVGVPVSVEGEAPSETKKPNEAEDASRGRKPGRKR